LLTRPSRGEPPEKNLQRHSAVQWDVERGTEFPYLVNEPEELAYIQDRSAS
jgi:hypothetical protein